MKNIFSILLLIPFSLKASVIGVSTHPFSENARVLSAEMTGYMSQRHEMGMGLRYTQEVGAYKLLDVTASGGQDSRALTMGAGMDFALLEEDVNQPRVSLKPYLQYQKFEDTRSNLVGVAPTMRKGFSVHGNEFFPYLALPSGIRLNSDNDEFDYYSSLTVGLSTRFPGAQNEKLLLSFEGNKNMGASSDYFGCLVSWVWN